MYKHVFPLLLLSLFFVTPIAYIDKHKKAFTSINDNST